MALERPRRGGARPPAQRNEGGEHEGGLVDVSAGGLVDEAGGPARRPGAVALGLSLEEHKADRERIAWSLSRPASSASARTTSALAPWSRARRSRE